MRKIALPVGFLVALFCNPAHAVENLPTMSMLGEMYLQDNDNTLKIRSEIFTAMNGVLITFNRFGYEVDCQRSSYDYLGMKYAVSVTKEEDSRRGPLRVLIPTFAYDAIAGTCDFEPPLNIN